MVFKLVAVVIKEVKIRGKKKQLDVRIIRN